ncbi:AAA family ATPase [Mycobacterium sp.]|uniref:AAA family ATPase n=1 Tax=Mycobacterium sp. TaxID=1785 RepID=UPI0031CE9383
MINEKGAASRTAHGPQITNTDKDAGKSHSSNGDAAGEDVQIALAFIEHLAELGVSLFSAEPGGRREIVPNDAGELEEVTLRQPGDPEFVRPKGWPSLTAEGNEARIGEYRFGQALCAICGKPIAVVDVDPRNGGDVERVQALLAELRVRIFAEVTTPGGGRHFYVAGHEDLPSTSWKKGDELAEFSGLDIQSHGRNVFLPLTKRLKYPGKDYTVLFDDLQALGTEGDPDGAAALAQWVAEQRYTNVRTTAAKRKDTADFDFERSQPWSGAPPDARQRAYLDRVLEENATKVATSLPGERNDTLFLAALKCASFVAGAGMDEQVVVDRLELAAVDCGLADEDGGWAVLATIGSGFRIGRKSPRAVPVERTVKDGQRREIEWISLDDIPDAAPKWAWTHEGLGRIQIAALTLFGGRPGTGKSTGARWFATRFSRGELEGCWKDKPQTVAYLAAEETAKYVLKPALRAAGADMKRIVTPKVKTAEGKYVALLADEDEHRLTADLITQKITVIVVDPVMSTIKGKTDIYRSNELREALDPWIRIAEAIDGIVIGIVHFVKGTTGDLISSINGGSAFGEVARCVFGFAKEASPIGGAPLRVMSQAKNSCGREDLSLEFAIESKWVTVSTGEDVEVGTFVLGDESDVSASELLAPRKGPRPLSPQMQLVLNHVNRQEGVVTPMDVFHAGFAKDNKAAGQMLRRLFERGLILNPRQGEYRRLPDSSPPSEEICSSRVGEEMKK